MTSATTTILQTMRRSLISESTLSRLPVFFPINNNECITLTEVCLFVKAKLLPSGFTGALWTVLTNKRMQNQSMLVARIPQQFPVSKLKRREEI